jgi:nitroreductase/NAD-dependent dihydropyrimidine dehydrogenase PreA subunit
MPTLDGKDVTIPVTDACTACGLCVKVCPCEYLEVREGKCAEKKVSAMGCITCGQCAAICPVAAISVESEGITGNDIIPFSDAKIPSYDDLFRLYAGRRSCRAFHDQPVPDDVVGEIIEAAQQAPAGLPPSKVRCVVVNGKDKVRSFAFDFLDEAKRAAWMFSKTGIWALRPFMSGEEHRKMRGKIAPLYRGLIAGRQAGQDFLFYDAPLVMVFLSSGGAADPVIACTYAMLAAESLGLSSCMIGTVAPMLPYTGQDFRRKHGIPDGVKDGLAIVFGYPKFRFQRSVRRKFRNIIRI